MPIKVTFVCNRCGATAEGLNNSLPLDWCNVNIMKMSATPNVRKPSHGGILCVGCANNAVNALKLDAIPVVGAPNA